MMEGVKIALVKQLGTRNCVIVDLHSIVQLEKMTKKKDNMKIVTLSFDGGIAWKVNLEKSLELCSEVTAILAEIE